jgi:hypothetical protein
MASRADHSIVKGNANILSIRDSNYFNQMFGLGDKQKEMAIFIELGEDSLMSVFFILPCNQLRVFWKPGINWILRHQDKCPIVKII